MKILKNNVEERFQNLPLFLIINFEFQHRRGFISFAEKKS